MKRVKRPKEARLFVIISIGKKWRNSCLQQNKRIIADAPQYEITEARRDSCRLLITLDLPFSCFSTFLNLIFVVSPQAGSNFLLDFSYKCNVSIMFEIKFLNKHLAQGFHLSFVRFCFFLLARPMCNEVKPQPFHSS